MSVEGILSAEVLATGNAHMPGRVFVQLLVAGEIVVPAKPGWIGLYIEQGLKLSK